MRLNLILARNGKVARLGRLGDFKMIWILQELGKQSWNAQSRILSKRMMDLKMHTCHIWSLQLLVSYVLDRTSLTFADRLPQLLQTHYHSPETLHRFRLPLQTAQQRFPSVCRSTPPRQAQNGVCPRGSIWTRFYTTPSQLPQPIPYTLNTASRPPANTAAHTIPR